MTFLAQLWLPIVLSAVVVFLVSSILHMVLTYHQSDFVKIPNEDAIQAELRKHNIPPGDYFVPNAGSIAGMKSPEFIEKMKQGPVFIATVLPSGPPKMGSSLLLWFLYSVVVGVFAAYIADRTLTPQTHYLEVFRVVGCSAFMGYSLALVQHSIWDKRKWSTTFKSMFDGLAYSLLTAGIFGWLWPRI